LSSDLKPPVDLNKPVENPALKRAVASHARAPTAASLAAVARELRTAHLLVAFFGDEFRTTPSQHPGQVTVDQGSVLKVITLRDAQNQPLFAAFTDWEEIYGWTKEKVSTLVMPPEQVFDWAFGDSMGMAAAGVVLNPASRGIQISRDLMRAMIDGKALPPGAAALNGRFSQLADLETVALPQAPAPDEASTQTMRALLQIPADKRDGAWAKAFLAAAPGARFTCGSPRFTVGPDLFRYLNLRSDGPDSGGETLCLRAIARDGAAHGFGATLNARDTTADWVFGCGELLWLAMRGDLTRPEEAAPAPGGGREVLKEAETVFTAAPAESYLPGSARRLLDEFMRDALGVAAPAVALMARPKQVPVQQLLFSIHPEERGEPEMQSALRRLSWFLPPHYVVVAVSRESDLVKSFVPLVAQASPPAPPAAEKEKKPWYRFW
jgi:hypothetical protein